MKRLRRHIFRSPAYLLIISLVIIFMIIATGGLLDLKMFQLRQMVVRERIMNLELSSRALHNKVDSGAESSELQQELGRNILESRVLNDPGEKPALDTGPSGPAVLMTNGVRLLLLKAPLRLESDAQKLMALKLAFYFERSRRYRQALRIYEKLQPRDFPEPFPAFLNLHTGFVHLALGQRDHARPLLEWVVEEYPATHFDRTARALLSLMEEQEEQEKKARAARDTLATADRMFQTRNCAGALQYYSRARKEGQSLSAVQNYRRALCLEQTGQIQESVALYRSIVAEGNQYSKEANRRLLMIGTFYGGGPEVKQQAEDRALAVGDLELVNQVDEAVMQTKEPEVFQEIQKWKEDNQDASGEGIIQDLLKQPDPELHRELSLRGVDVDDTRPNADAQKDKKEKEREEEIRNGTAVQERLPDQDTTALQDREPERENGSSNPYAKIQEALAGLDASDYRLPRPSLKRWPARLNPGEEEKEVLLLVQDVEGNFRTGDGETLDAASLKSVRAHPRGKLLLRLKDGRLFLADEINFRNGQFQAGPLRIPLNLLHQIAAY